MNQSRTKGISLVEALTAMALLCVLAGIGLPAFQGQIQRQRAAATLHLLGAQFATARATAVARRIPVSVCPANGSDGCRTDSDWSRGWIMYTDPSKQAQPAGEASVLRRENLPGRSGLQVLSSAGRRSIRFLPDGRSAGSNLRVRVCGDGRLLGEVVVNNLGRIRSSRSTGPKGCDD